MAGEMLFHKEQRKESKKKKHTRNKTKKKKRKQNAYTRFHIHTHTHTHTHIYIYIYIYIIYIYESMYVCIARNKQVKSGKIGEEFLESSKCLLNMEKKNMGWGEEE